MRSHLHGLGLGQSGLREGFATAFLSSSRGWTSSSTMPVRAATLAEARGCPGQPTLPGRLGRGTGKHVRRMPPTTISPGDAEASKDPSGAVVFHTATGISSVAGPGAFALLLPCEPHRPASAPAAPAQDKRPQPCGGGLLCCPPPEAASISHAWTAQWWAGGRLWAYADSKLANVLFMRSLPLSLRALASPAMQPTPGEVCLSGCSASFLFPRSHPRPFPCSPSLSLSPQNLQSRKEAWSREACSLLILKPGSPCLSLSPTPQAQMLKAG